ncbi:hypothetical protein NC651_030080 [Populus alba x Populus x berolinensis]|nr:hypothetical protein NC651_030080 [Populus alba x Populus x berolinensis]
MGFLARKRGFLAPLLLALLLVQRFSAVVSALNYTISYRQVSSLRLERIQRHLDKINKPPVMTIERNPPERPRVKTLKEDDKTKKSNVEEGVIRGSWQTWHRNGQGALKELFPIRRSTVHDVLRSKSLFDFGKKQAPISLARRKDAPDVVSANGHELLYIIISICCVQEHTKDIFSLRK